MLVCWTIIYTRVKIRTPKYLYYLRFIYLIIFINLPSFKENKTLTPFPRYSKEWVGCRNVSVLKNNSTQEEKVISEFLMLSRKKTKQCQCWNLSLLKLITSRLYNAPGMWKGCIYMISWSLFCATFSFSLWCIITQIQNTKNANLSGSYKEFFNTDTLINRQIDLEVVLDLKRFWCLIL